MRIISGDLKGRRFTGKIPDFIRPTTDNVREAIFNILTNYISFDGLKVGDLCAGTGFYGFEAISRGAEKVYFFEKVFKACKLIDEVARKLNISSDNYEIIKGDIVKTLKLFSEFYPDEKFDLMFFDPPYKAIFFNEVLELILDLNLLSENGILVVESSDIINLKVNSYNLIVKKDYGKTRLTVFELAEK